MSLMTEQSKQALAQAFFRAARAGLLRAPEDALDISPLAGGKPSGQPGDTVLVITTSSFSFRLLTMFHIAATPESRTYYGGAADAKIETAFSEIANLCCGALNRELSYVFPHLGMSIPYSLRNECLSCLDELKPEYVSRYAISINSNVRLEATLCMCCSAPVEVTERSGATEQATGELELF